VVPGRRRWRLVRQAGNGVAAACAAAAVLVACAVGYRGLPALGPVLVPGGGAWASAAGGLLPESQVLELPGLAGAVRVSFDAHGIPTINAASMADAMAALGYLHARFRLTQMELQRRLAEGRLSQLVGPAGIPSDVFELRLGLLRTARQEWAAMPRNGSAAVMLTAYSRGINDYLAQLRANGQWPAAFWIAGVFPARWTPVDSLAVQGGLAQALDYSTVPLDYALLSRALGIARTMRWLPVSGASQHVYDRGPYRALGVAPLAGASGPARAARAAGPSRAVGPHRAAGRGRAGQARGANTTAAQVSPAARAAVKASAPAARAAAAALAATSALPALLRGDDGAGTAWAVNGPKVAGGGSMLAADAPVPEPLPSAWYQIAISAPKYDVTGVTLPGLPGVVIGHNRRISWSLGGTQDQSALYYVEKTTPSRPGRYFWRGRWRAMRQVRYAIQVRGERTRYLTVRLTVHGPVLTRAGETVSVDWTGSAGSPDVAALARLGAAASFRQFETALAGWRSPAQTFVYADRRGNIGAVTAGYYPVVRRGDPWMLMPGTGPDDVVGVIPFAALPRSFDPPGHVIAVAGQRPVTAAYPYYIGTTASDRDAYGSAGRASAMLAKRSRLRPADLAALQTSHGDEVAATVVPRLLAALRGVGLTPAEQHAASALRGWNHSMDGQSAAAAIWAAFWPAYVSATFGPWWHAAAWNGRAGLAGQLDGLGLARALEHWTVDDPSNPAFAPPGQPGGTAASVMRAAFGTAVARLRARLGGAPASWSLDRALSGPAATTSSAGPVPVLGHDGIGPVPAGSRPWRAGRTVDVGLPEGLAGQRWRMIVRLGGRGPAPPGHAAVWAEGIYPGGQSENPASPWYASMTGRWRDGGYLQMASAGAAAAGQIRWVLVP
jgi:penicillin G amidase